MPHSLDQLLQQRRLFNSPRHIQGDTQTVLPGVQVSQDDPIDELVAQQQFAAGDAPDQDFIAEMDQLDAEGVDVPALIVGPGGRKEGEVRKFEPGAMRQIGVMAREPRNLGASDEEIMTTVRKMRVKQLETRADKTKFSVLSDDEIADLDLPKGTLMQRDEKTGRLHIVKSPHRDSANARETVLRKLQSGEGIISPGEKDLLILTIQDPIQLDSIERAVADHNARIRAGSGGGIGGATAAQPRSLGGRRPALQLQPAPRNPAARVKGQRYTNPNDPNDILLWDGNSFIRE